MRLFVDVDDTLIRWPRVALVSGDSATPCPHVVHLAREFRRSQMASPEEGHQLVIWSLGGADYARKWAAVCGIEADAYRAKEPMIPRPGDLFIDDDPLPSFRAASIHPDMLRWEATDAD